MGKLTNSPSFFNSPIKSHFSGEPPNLHQPRLRTPPGDFQSPWHFSFRALATSVVDDPFETPSPRSFAVHTTVSPSPLLLLRSRTSPSHRPAQVRAPGAQVSPISNPAFIPSAFDLAGMTQAKSRQTFCAGPLPRTPPAGSRWSRDAVKQRPLRQQAPERLLPRVCPARRCGCAVRRSHRTRLAAGGALLSSRLSCAV